MNAGQGVGSKILHKCEVQVVGVW